MPTLRRELCASRAVPLGKMSTTNFSPSAWRQREDTLGPQASAALLLAEGLAGWFANTGSPSITFYRPIS